MAFNVGSIVATLKADFDNMKSGFESAKSSISDFEKGASESFTKVGTAFTAMGALGVGAIALLADGAMEGQVAMAQLEHAVVEVSGGTMEQVAALEELAVQLQATGVLNKDAIITGQAQLSTFGLSTEAVYELTTSMADLAVNQFGVSATSDDLTSTANMMAKALQGQFGVLEKSGIRFTEAQQEMILYGTEMEKVQAINEGFAQNLKFTNEVAMQTFTGQLENLKNKFGEAIGPLEDAMLPALEKLADLAGKVADWLMQLDPQILTIAGTVLVAGTAFLAITGPLLLLIGYLPTLAAGFGTLATVIGAIVSPVGLVVVAILALIAAGVYLYTHWEEVKAFAEQTWNGILEFFESVFEGITTMISDFVELVVTFFMDNFVIPIQTMFNDFLTLVQTVFDGIQTVITYVMYLIFGLIITVLEALGVDWKKYWDLIKSTAETIWTGIQEFFTAAFEAFKAVFDSLTLYISTVWSTLWSTVTGIASATWETIKGVVSSGLGYLSDLINSAMDPIIQGVTNTWDSVYNVITGVWESIKQAVKDGINQVISWINSFIAAANAVASKVPGAPTFSTIPLLAEGGRIIGSGLAIVGEAGPELVKLNAGASVIPLSGNSGVSGPSVNIYYPTVRSDSDLDAMKTMIEDIIGRKQELASLGITQ